MILVPEIDLLRSVWSVPTPESTSRAFDFHASALARWLKAAGAEPRLALLFVTGDAAKARLRETLDADGVEVVEAPASASTPIHAALARHQGDHFNRKLYWVELQTGAPESLAETWQALERERSRLRQAATWVALVIDSVASLAALRARAPRLEASALSRVVLVEPEPARARAGESAPGVSPPPASVAEAVYRELSDDSVAPTYLGFSRVVRAGYAASLVGQQRHPERQRLAALWADAGEGALPFAVAQSGPAAAEALVRHALGRLPEAAIAPLVERAGDPTAAILAGAPPPDALRAYAAVLAMGNAERPFDRAAVDALGDALSLPDGEPSGAGALGHGARVHAELAIAAAWARVDDIDACVAALRRAERGAERSDVLPELRLEVLEKRVALEQLLGNAAAAREALGRLEALVPTLCSPHYAARARLARAELVAPLDAARAHQDLAEAARLFAAHGYPDWADLAEQSVDAER